MDEFLPDLHLIWRPVEFASVGGMDALQQEYSRVIDEGGHAWWTQRLSLTYIRLLDRVLESGRTVHLFPVANPREAGQQIFRLRARIGDVLYNPDGSFVPQPDELLPFRRSSADRIYSACWIKLVSMETIPPAELPEPNDYLVLPYGDDLLEALDNRFSKGFILPRAQYDEFRKTNLARRLETLDRVSRTAGEAQRRQVVTKLRDFERRVAETVAEDARSGELAFDIVEGRGVGFPLDEERARRIGAVSDKAEHELRVDRRDRSLIIDAPDLDLEDSEERRSMGEVKVELGGDRRGIVTHTDEDSFDLEREIDDDTLGEEERQLLELGIDWDVLHRMRRQLAGLEEETTEPRGEAAVKRPAAKPAAPAFAGSDLEPPPVGEAPPPVPRDEATDEDGPVEEPAFSGSEITPPPEPAATEPAATEPTATDFPGSDLEPPPVGEAPPPVPRDETAAADGPVEKPAFSGSEITPPPDDATAEAVAAEPAFAGSDVEPPPEISPSDDGATPLWEKPEARPAAAAPPEEAGKAEEPPGTAPDFRASLPTTEDIARALEGTPLGSDGTTEPPTSTPDPEPEPSAPPAGDAGPLDEIIEPLEALSGPPSTAEPADADRLPEPALTSRELEREDEETDAEKIEFPDLPPLKPETPRSKSRDLRGINLFEESAPPRPAAAEDDEEPHAGSRPSDDDTESRPDRLLIPTVDTLLRSAEDRERRRRTTPEPEEQPLALPRDVATGIRKIREHLVIDSEQIAHIITNLLLGKHVIIGGPTGCGKSTLARLIPTLIWNIYPEIVQTMSTWGADDLLGQVYPLPDGGSAVSGVLTRTVLKNYTAEGSSYKRNAYQAPNGARYDGVWLVIDELDNCDWTSLLSDFLASADADHLRIPVVSSPGETVDIPLPQDFRLLATFNDPDGPARMEKLSQSTRRRLAFVELHSPSDERAERHAVRRHVQSMVYEQLGLATRQSDFGDQIENTLFRFARLVRAYRDIGTAPLITILADVQVETQMGLDAWKTLDEAMATNLIPLLGGMAPGELRILGNLAANTPERIHAYLASNLPKRYRDEDFRDQLHRYLVFLYRTSLYRRDHYAEDVKELIELVAAGIPQGEVPTLVRAIELREGNLATSLLPALKLGSTLFETIRGLTKLINVATGRR
ncbi:MAG: AAA domain-containing protein [Candidatus Coatesbacteria bacterium]|nr:AAA domain-containing protein [Candidatus Coatesbacteria bacterium]